jgi:hypothetical protein
MILKGKEITTGGTIIMPIAINTLAAKISIIKNGRKIIKPIINAVFNSETINDGTKTNVGTLARVFG